MKNYELVYNGVVFTYGVYESSNPRYSKVICMHIIDPSTGKRMTKIKSRHTEFEPDKVVELAKYAYIGKNKASNDKEILKEARRCAEKMYSQYETQLLRQLQTVPSIGSINSNQMYIRYIDAFMRTQKTASSATQKEKRRVLKNACTELMKKPIDKLTEKDIEKLLKNATCEKRKNLIRDFFEYCRNKGAYAGVNPVLNYLESNNLRKKKSSKKSYLNILSHIPIEIEKELHRCILKHIDDKEIMAIILIKCHGVSISRVCSMRWNEIEEIEDQILIKGQNNNTGSFHRMDRPILFEGAFLIKEKKKRLLESVGDPDKVAKSLVVPIRKGDQL